MKKPFEQPESSTERDREHLSKEELKEHLTERPEEITIDRLSSEDHPDFFVYFFNNFHTKFTYKYKKDRSRLMTSLEQVVKRCNVDIDEVADISKKIDELTFKAIDARGEGDNKTGNGLDKEIYKLRKIRAEKLLPAYKELRHAGFSHNELVG